MQIVFEILVTVGLILTILELTPKSTLLSLTILYSSHMSLFYESLWLSWALALWPLYVQPITMHWCVRKDSAPENGKNLNGLGLTTKVFFITLLLNCFFYDINTHFAFYHNFSCIEKLYSKNLFQKLLCRNQIILLLKNVVSPDEIVAKRT